MPSKTGNIIDQMNWQERNGNWVYHHDANIHYTSATYYVSRADSKSTRVSGYIDLTSRIGFNSSLSHYYGKLQLKLEDANYNTIGTDPGPDDDNFVDIQDSGELGTTTSSRLHFETDCNSDKLVIKPHYWCSHAYEASIGCNNDTGNDVYYGLDITIDVPPYNPYTPPGSITNLRVNNVTAASVNNQSDNINLTWSAPSGGTDGISGYRIYYKTSGNYIELGTTSNTSYTTKIANINNTMARDTTISFKVIPYNAKGSGGDSNVVTCKFNNVQCNLSKNSVTHSSIKVNWSSQVQIKKVEYSIGSGWVSQTVSASSGVIEITGLNPSTAYTVNVKLTADSHEGGTATNSITLTTNAITARASTSNLELTSVRINWNCDVKVKQVEYKLNNNNYKVATTGINSTSGSFVITGLTYKTAYTVQLSLVTNVNNTRVSCSTSFTTLDIARITEYPTTWNIDDAGTIKVKLPNTSNAAYAFSISYKGTEVVSRSNITITNNQYTFNLTNQEKLYIYNITNLVSAPKVKLNLKTYQSVHIGTDSKETTLAFNTKAWVKVNDTTWKRALVWLKVNGQWRTTTPWVKVGSTWKKI